MSIDREENQGQKLEVLWHLGVRRKDNSVKTLRRRGQEGRKETAKCIVL